MINSFHLVGENKTVQVENDFHNEVLIIFSGMKGPSVHILKTSHKSFPKEDFVLQGSNSILNFISEIDELDKDNKFEIIIISNKISKHYIDFLKEKSDSIYTFEYGDILFPKDKTVYRKEPIHILYNVKPLLLQVTGYSSMMTNKKVHYVFHNRVWTEYNESIFT